LLSQVGVSFDDSKPIDAKELSPGRYILRYLDGQDGLVVAAEFDGEFRLLSEARAKIAGGEDDSSNFAYYSGH